MSEDPKFVSNSGLNIYFVGNQSFSLAVILFLIILTLIATYLFGYYKVVENKSDPTSCNFQDCDTMPSLINTLKDSPSSHRGPGILRGSR